MWTCEFVCEVPSDECPEGRSSMEQASDEVKSKSCSDSRLMSTCESKEVAISSAYANYPILCKMVTSFLAKAQCEYVQLLLLLCCLTMTTLLLSRTKGWRAHWCWYSFEFRRSVSPTNCARISTACETEQVIVCVVRSNVAQRWRAKVSELPSLGLWLFDNNKTLR